MMVVSPMPVSQKNSVFSRLHKFWKNEGGATAVAMGLMSPVIIGGMALGGETGYWYYTARKLQNAADTAAYSAAVRKRAGDTGTKLDAAAIRAAASTGFKPKLVDLDPDPVSTEWIATNLFVNNPPQTGVSAKDHQAVEVRLFEVKARLLSSIFSKDPIRIESRAVARLSDGTPACVIALSQTKQKAVEVSGSSSATLKDCGVASNSVQDTAYYMPNSSAYLAADCISTVGGSSIKNPSEETLDLNEQICPSVQENAPAIPDPYAMVEEPDFSDIECATSNVVSGTVDPGPHHVMRFCGGLTVKDKTSVTFLPGLYIVDGGNMSMNGGTISGQGVTFFFANNATAKLAGNPFIDLVAPNASNKNEATESLMGLVFFGARCTLNSPTCDELFKITGAPNSTIQGAIYLPGSEVEFLGNSTASNICFQIIADRVIFTGNSTIKMGSNCKFAGTKEAKIAQIIRLTE
ncbi:TadE/TadG family type IV pilus assembly protein [Microvirga solisilvae]|uniref:TadE/TadG family type IV pilus assembly protein n=1 Tax=Microvirga solisilvae TaxID=2919498 RepID=UPI001FAF1A04|nr:pilus assembly protein TadG-related protein [Microvirga solisilvae]